MLDVAGRQHLTGCSTSQDMGQSHVLADVQCQLPHVLCGQQLQFELWYSTAGMGFASELASQKGKKFVVTSMLNIFYKIFIFIFWDLCSHRDM